MTVQTLYETKHGPTIVLGFTVPSWADRDLKTWAKNCRAEDLRRFGDFDTLNRCRHQALEALGRTRDYWLPEKLVPIITDFRKSRRLKPFNQGLGGLAFAFPEFESRIRCPICLCSTEFRPAAEDSSPLKDTLALLPSYQTVSEYLEACAENELVLVVKDLARELGKKVLGSRTLGLLLKKPTQYRWRTK